MMLSLWDHLFCGVLCEEEFLLACFHSSIIAITKDSLGVETSDSDTRRYIVKAIVGATDYDEEFAKSTWRLLKEEIEREREREREKLERECRERDKERQFELDKLKLTTAAETVSLSSNGSASTDTSRKSNLKHLVPKFDPKQLDVSLFFEIFERQAKKEEIEEERWVSQLIPLLPPEVAELIVKEPLEKSDDFPHMKRLLMKRFKLNSVELRIRFEEHNRKFGSSWADLTFELRSYLDNWLETAEVNTFEELKELLLTEQLKKRTPAEGHIKPNCPEFKRAQGEQINHIGDTKELSECFAPYISTGKINGEVRKILRDSGASIDVCPRSWIKTEDFTGEYVYVKQPLDEECKCLPLAKIYIETDEGCVYSKAAIKNTDSDARFYLLGNRTAELFSRSKSKPEALNAVETRGSLRRKQGGTEVNSTTQETLNANVFPPPGGEELDTCSLPPIEPFEGLALAEIDSKSFEKEQKLCSVLKPLWEEVSKGEGKDFKCMKGKLVRLSRSKLGEERVQLCIPSRLTEKIMKFCHDGASGHLGATKMKDKVLRHFFWPNCYAEIESYVRACDACQRVGKKGDRKKAPLKIVPIISEPFAVINIDAVGVLPLSKNGNKYLITSICMASKYPDAIPVPDIKSPNVIDALLKTFSRTGFPREVQSDLGRSFTSLLTTEFFDRFGIKVRHSSICHPSSNPVERMHSSIKRILKALCVESGEDWEKNLPLALFALRSVNHESTGFSPAELVHGKNLRTPQTLLYENWMVPEESDPNVVEYILNLTNRLKRCQDLAVEKMSEMQVRRKAWYDKNAVNRQFKVGDQVLVLATNKANKMAVNWIGPGVVTSKISETNYVVDVPERRDKCTIYHVNLLKPYHKRPERVNLIIEEEGEDVEQEAEIPFPLPDPTYFDLHEMLRASKLEKRVSEKQIDQLGKVLQKHKRVFSSDPGCTKLVTMDIELTSADPVRSRPYRMSPRQTEIVREEIKRLLDLGIVEIGQSDYTSPLILVEVPGKDPRPCVDYRKLNAITRTEFFPLPNIEEVVERVSAAPYITLMDLIKGYFQIPLTERASRYAAFVTPFGTYRPKNMMFGLLNAPYYFVKLLAQVLNGFEHFTAPYIDDIAIYSQSWEQHVIDVDKVLERLGDAKLTVKPSKCRFAQDSVRFLGHDVGSGKRSPSEAKLKAVQDFPTPTTKTLIRSFLGLVGYYGRYIPNFSEVAAPLTSALKGRIRKEKVVWTDECEEAFRALKGSLLKSPILYAPDFSKEFILQTDASESGMRIVLAQMHNGEEHPVLYLSKKFSKAEKNYSVIEKELAAIVYGLKKLAHYLNGQFFRIQTDHSPITYLKKMMGTNARLTRWALCLQQFNFEIEHKSGKRNGNADGLSRQEP
ncbi:uncharacterized protein LOC129228494 [Uloborus diversus]|uniref:uncharacterized protein LOC129228494 n=1 Tax=Uloborus diversus TaxID=327109 RepID=UPI002409DA98|nr:uncharacterized protein LOC129228494 [Uloborus diversus]